MCTVANCGSDATTVSGANIGLDLTPSETEIVLTIVANFADFAVARVRTDTGAESGADRVVGGRNVEADGNFTIETSVRRLANASVGQ